MPSVRRLSVDRALTGTRAVALAVTASLTLASATTLAVALPAAHANTAPSGGLATVHPIAPITLVDTSVGIGSPKRALRHGKGLYVQVGGTHSLPAATDSLTLSVLVTGATGNGQLWIGPGKVKAAAALAVGKGRQSVASFTSQLSVKHSLYLSYAGTGSVQVRVVAEAYTAGDLTGSSYFPTSPIRVADTWKGVGLPAHLLGRHSSATVQIAGRAGIPASATAALVTVSTNSASGSGAITAGASRSNTAPVVAFSRGTQVTAAVLSTLSPTGKLTLVNSSDGKVGVIVSVVGYYVSGTTGLLFQAIAPTPVVDTGTGIGSPRSPLSATARTVGVRAAAQLPASARAVTVSLLLPAPGRAAVSAGATGAAMSTVLLTEAGQPADASTVLPLSASGSFSVRAKGARVQARINVLGYFAPLPGTPGQPSPTATTPPVSPPTSTPPTTSPPTSTPPTTTPPTSTPPTTTPPVVNHPSVAHVSPANNATNVNPLTTSVVTDLILPNGGVLPSSLNASTVSLVNNTTHAQVPAHYSTSGGADTINVSPSVPLAANTTYTFTVTGGATDVTGVGFTPFSSTFKTGSAPRRSTRAWSSPRWPRSPPARCSPASPRAPTASSTPQRSTATSSGTTSAPTAR